MQQVQQHLDAIKTILAPYLTSLTPEERKTLPRMADKTVVFSSPARRPRMTI